MRNRPVLWLSLFFLVAPASLSAQGKPRPKLPNIVWITSEDHGPHLACYGVHVAKTPALNGLAKKGMRYRRAWSNAPVCAPSRTAIITGMYPTSTGSEHMRSLTMLPPGFHMFPFYLRSAGYYCTNKVKEDYNLVKTKGTWDDSSNKAHWKNRKPGQPFFAVFNSTKSHESQIRNYKKEPRMDRAKVPIPSYHPDTLETRTDWAHYFDNLELVDADAAEVLRELEEAGLLDDTIVIFFSDHGSGMPRNKRTPLNCGLHVPMIVWFPEGWRHLAPPEYRPGGTSDRLVSFVDLAPTMLSLAGVEPKDWMQGQPFAGPHAKKEGPAYLFGFRGRMDERYDFQRSVTDGRFVYLRNYLPHLPAGQHVEYMFQTRTTKAWKDLYDMGKLNEAQSLFWKAPRPIEELYDLQSDPDEVRNMLPSLDVKINQIAKQFRQVQRDHFLKVRDVGFLPEDEIHVRAKGAAPYAMGQDPKKYPLERILPWAEGSKKNFAEGLKDDDSAIRYWAVMHLLMAGEKAVPKFREALHQTLEDPSPSVRVVGAEVLATFGDGKESTQAVTLLVGLAEPGKNSPYIRLAALNALDRLGEAVRPHRETIGRWPTEVPKGQQRFAYGIPRLLEKIQGQLK